MSVRNEIAEAPSESGARRRERGGPYEYHKPQRLTGRERTGFTSGCRVFRRMMCEIETRTSQRRRH